MGSSCNDITVFKRGLVHTGGNETGNVSHIHHEVTADLVGDFPHTSVVDLTAVGRGTSDKNLRTVHECILFEPVVVDQASFKVDTVWEGLEIGGDGRDPKFAIVSGQKGQMRDKVLTSSVGSGSRGSNVHRAVDPNP